MRKRFERGIISLLAALFVLSVSAQAQEYAPAFPRAGALKAKESDSFIIWKVTREKGKSTGMHKVELDQVSVTIVGGAVKFTKPDGTWRMEEERLGSVRFDPKGTVVAEEGLSDEPSQVTVFQIKDVSLPPWPRTEGVAGHFPRPGAIKLFETDRFTVWEQTWAPGVLLPLHLHYLRGAAVFLDGGKIRHPITSKGIAGTAESRERGEIILNEAPIPAPHEEIQDEGIPREVYVEIKNHQ